MAVRDVFEVDPTKLDRIAAEQATGYQTAQPFPHIVMDDFVDPVLLEEVLAEVLADEAKIRNDMNDRFQRKSANASTRDMRPKTRQLINFMNGQEMINFLGELTGIEGLVADPQLAGGGIHALREGGYLNVHADFNLHRGLKLDRRINLLLYLNKDWKAEYGGTLELWDKQMSACEKSVVPLFNRCVIFNTTDWSFHGNPHPVTAPEGRTRLSLAFYYYSNGRPAEEQGNPHATVFKHRPGEETAKDRLRKKMKRYVPPVLTEWMDRRR